MPLEKSGSEQAFKKNVGTLMGEVGKSKHVQSRDQALAIAFDIKRRNRAAGGAAPDDEKSKMPLNILPYSQPRGRVGTVEGVNVKKELLDKGSFETTPRVTGRENDVLNARGLYAKGGSALGVAYKLKGKKRAAGGQLKPASWQTRSEARGMMHAGPILSAVAGRTDHHPMNVKAGSYVFPADHVSSMGQGNTLAGVAQLNHMFKMGPYGSAPSRMGHGAGLPKPPRIAHAKGGSAGDNGIGHPVPINAAGGEVVVPPEKILEWMERSGFTPDLDAGHKALDAWVIQHRKTHVKTLKQLPGPAKD